MGVANLPISTSQQLQILGSKASANQQPQGLSLLNTSQQLQALGGQLGMVQGGAPISPAGYMPGSANTNPNDRYVAPSAAAPQLTAAQQAAAAQAAQQAAAAKAINAGYGLVIDQFDNELNDLPGQINAANSLVDSQYGAQRGSTETQYGIGNSNLQFARDQLGTQTSRSVRSLADSIRQSFDSYSTMIGAGGGGDSSATGQLSYALQKAQAQNRTQIYNNASDQMGQITQQQSSLDANHTDQVKQLDAWKAQQVISIGQQFRAQQQRIEEAKAGASRDKLLALANLNTDLVNQAVSALSGVQAQHQAATQAITAAINAPNTNAASLGAVSYSPTAAAAPTLPGYSSTNGSTSGDSFVTALPASLRKLQTV